MIFNIFIVSFLLPNVEEAIESSSNWCVLAYYFGVLPVKFKKKQINLVWLYFLV
jgi:hypothetical protein